MTRNVKFVLAGLVVFFAACGLTVFFVAFEKVEEEVREPPSGEARRNPHLALERLLTRFDYGARTVRKLSEPHADTTIVVLANASYDFSPEQVEAWATWVESGGHLVLHQPGEAADAQTAPLLARLGFSPETDENKKDSTWPDEAESRQLAIEHTSNEAAPLTWVAQDADWLVVDEEAGVFAASRPANGGRVTLLENSLVLTNNAMGAGEHATLAVETMALPTAAGQNWDMVTIVMYGQRQSWMLYVLGHTWPFFAAVLAALLLAIRAGRNRFGPILADPPVERRSRREHIDAVGRFMWQQGSVASLVEAAQQALAAELEHRRPRLAHAHGAERDEIIAEELDITAAQARELFRRPTGNRDAARFIERIRKLEQHRRRL